MVIIRQVDLNDPDLQKLLPKDKKHALVFAAFEDNIPAGWITTYAYPAIKEALLTSLKIIPGQQNKGIGLQLMRHLLDHLKGLGFRLLNFQYDACPIMEKLLKKTGWEPSTLLMRRYFLHHKTFTPEWFLSNLPILPEDYSLFLWKEALSEEIETVKDWAKSNPQIEQYSPFDAEHPFDPTTSLGLRYKDKLVGWMVNHRLNPKLLRYSAFYVVPEVRGLGPSIHMLKESIRLHLADELEMEGMMEINFKLSPNRWIQFIEKRLAPYAVRIEDMRYAFHYLK